MSESDPQFDAGEPELPIRLREALMRLHEPRIAVPPAIDQAILARARRNFHQRRRAWTVLRWTGSAAAAAAIIALAVRVFVPSPNGGHPAGQRTQLAKIADVNRDGRVNIVDAYIVARKIARHEPLDAAWDVNGDGVVDQKDVDLIAHMAVQVSGGPPQ